MAKFGDLQVAVLLTAHPEGEWDARALDILLPSRFATTCNNYVRYTARLLSTLLSWQLRRMGETDWVSPIYILEIIICSSLVSLSQKCISHPTFQFSPLHDLLCIYVPIAMLKATVPFDRLFRRVRRAGICLSILYLELDPKETGSLERYSLCYLYT